MAHTSRGSSACIVCAMAWGTCGWVCTAQPTLSACNDWRSWTSTTPRRFSSDWIIPSVIWLYIALAPPPAPSVSVSPCNAMMIGTITSFVCCVGMCLHGCSDAAAAHLVASLLPVVDVALE